MKEFLLSKTSFLDHEIPEVEESEDDMIDNLLGRLGMG